MLSEHRACPWPQIAPKKDDSRHDFRLAEYQTLREEIAASVEETRRIERYAAIVAAAVWVWALGRSASLAGALASLIPVLVSLLGGIRVFALYQVTMAIGAYILEVEDAYRHPTISGWEHFSGFAVSDINQRPRALERRYVSRSAWTYWLLLLAAAIAFAVLEWQAYITGTKFD